MYPGDASSPKKPKFPRQRRPWDGGMGMGPPPAIPKIAKSLGDVSSTQGCLGGKKGWTSRPSFFNAKIKKANQKT